MLPHSTLHYRSSTIRVPGRWSLFSCRFTPRPGSLTWRHSDLTASEECGYENIEIMGTSVPTHTGYPARHFFATLVGIPEDLTTLPFLLPTRRNTSLFPPHGSSKRKQRSGYTGIGDQSMSQGRAASLPKWPASTYHSYFSHGAGSLLLIAEGMIVPLLEIRIPTAPFA